MASKRSSSQDDSVLIYVGLGFLVWMLMRSPAQGGTVAHSFQVASDQQTVKDTVTGITYTLATDSGFNIGSPPDWSLSADGSTLTEQTSGLVYQI